MRLQQLRLLAVVAGTAAAAAAAAAAKEQQARRQAQDVSPNDSTCGDLCASGTLCTMAGFGSGGAQFECRDVDECTLTYNVGEAPWTDYGRRRLQDSGGEVGGGDGGEETAVGVCDRLTECTNFDPTEDEAGRGYVCSACPNGFEVMPAPLLAVSANA